MAKLMICRIGWMEKYAGIAKTGDTIVGGGAYVEDHGYGGEIYNFLRGTAHVYGYVQVNGTNHIERLGASTDAEKVDGVTVVWAARHPKGGVYVVGWYRNATVFRQYQDHPNNNRRKEPGKRHLFAWNVIARSDKIHLLPATQRNFRLPVGKDALGSSLTNYVDGQTASERHLKLRLLKYVGSRGHLGLMPKPKPKGKKGHGGGYQKNLKLRIKVEKAAMKFVEKRYVDLGWKVIPVHKDNLGWDFDATMGKRVLRIEAKGCSSGIASCELTPNEFDKSKKHRDTYAICIVTNALTKGRKLWEFTFEPESSTWNDRDGNSLVFKELVAAALRVRPQGRT